MYMGSGKAAAESSRTVTGTLVVKASCTIPKFRPAPRPPALDPVNTTRFTFGNVGTRCPTKSFMLLYPTKWPPVMTDVATLPLSFVPKCTSPCNTECRPGSTP